MQMVSMYQKNINKAFYFYSLAATQNHVSAINNLGCLYFENKLSPKDINKAIHYFTLGA